MDLFTRRPYDPSQTQVSLLSFPGAKITRVRAGAPPVETRIRGPKVRKPVDVADDNTTTELTGAVRADPPAGLVPVPDDPRLRKTVAALVEAGGPSVATILLYGSHVQASAPDKYSAYDFLIITDSYADFFRRLCSRGHHGKPAWLLTALSHVLAPNIISFSLGNEESPPAKCAVVSLRHLRRSLKPYVPDHFLKGRVVQKLAQVYSRGRGDQDDVISAVREAREGVVHWVRPFLPGDFTLEGFGETMLRVSYRGEIRPESPKRVDQVFQAQKETLLEMAGGALAAAVRRGSVTREGGKYRWTRNPGRGAKTLLTIYFAASKARATARWFKYMITFEGWLDYVARKIERRAGFTVELEERERRWPLIFLWPKVFRVLRTIRNSNPPVSEEDSS